MPEKLFQTVPLSDNQELAKAHEEGRAAAVAGMARDVCPYDPGFSGYSRERRQWLQGWVEGKTAEGGKR